MSLQRKGVKLQAGSFANRPLCQTLLNALEISRVTTNDFLESLREGNHVQALYKNSLFLFIYKHIYYSFSVWAAINNLQANYLIIFMSSINISWLEKKFQALTSSW